MSAVLATLATGLFAGAALYVTLVEHPARVACGVDVAVAEFRRSYPRATALQAPLALIAALAAVVEWTSGGDRAWLAIAVLMAGIVVFTLVVILPTNKKLEDHDLDVGSTATRDLLRRWGMLHAVRTLASLTAFGMALVLLA
jgi:hypothetical protein